MSTELAYTNGSNGAAAPLPAAVEAALAEGNVGKLTTEQRVAYYNATCASLGLNPLTRPFEYITLNGKLTLYATRACTEQLRYTRKISLQITNRERIGDVYVVTARATMADGRTDESTGAVTLTGLKGDALCNAMMKAETKSKRRVTLSICGLGFLDESETETIAGAKFEPIKSITEVYRSPSVTEEALEAIHAEFAGENPWLHRIESERSPSRGKAVYELPDTAWKKIMENPGKALMHFCEADREAILGAIDHPELKPE